MLVGPGMTSTYLGYRIYASNLSQSLQRVAAEPQNASDQKYFEANINKVTSADQFVNNYRLFTYAMKAYGLSDLGNAKALMKKVLESDLSDSNSFANRLTDTRYAAFAKAFNFTTTGAVASTGQLQTQAQRTDLLNRIDPAGLETAALTSSLSAVTSVGAFEANASLYDQVLTAYGLDPTTTLKSDVTAALQSDLSNPGSFANSAGGATLRALATDFNFASDGTIGGQRLLQSAASTRASTTAYMKKIAADPVAQANAKAETAYYATKIPELTSVDQLVSDPRLVAYVKTAYGLDPNLLSSQLKSVLTSNLLDSKSVANTYGVDASKPSTGSTPYQLVAEAFSVGTDGTAWDHSAPLSSASLTVITTAYTTAETAAAAARNAKGADAAAATKAAQTETNYFTSSVANITSVSGLLSDSRLVAYIRTAFDLPAPATAQSGQTATGVSLADLGKILTSDVLSPASVANTTGASARKLATSFNFAPNGFVYAQRPIQNAANVTATTTAYAAQAGTTTPAKADAQTETDYYTSTLPRLASVDDLLADKRIVAYLSKAYNLPATQTSVLRQVLTSNLLDPKSKANTLGGGYETLAAAFDISSDGSIAHAPDKAVQTKTGIATAHADYLEQVMETEAGTQDGDGVRLALYFQRLAPTITSAYQILSDKALTKVVQTMLGLSSTSSNADIDSQARTITSKLNLADLKDPKKLDKLVARFAALYDLTNSSSDSSSTSTLTV